MGCSWHRLRLWYRVCHRTLVTLGVGLARVVGLSVGKNIAWNSFGSIVYLVCQWLITLFVVRLSSGFDDAGVLALAMAVSNVFAPIALYKIRSYQVSDVNHRVSSGEFIAFRLVTIAAGFIVVVPYTLFTCPESSFVPVILYIAFRAGDIFIDVLHGVDQLNDRMDYCGISMAIRGILFLLAFSAVLACGGSLSMAIFAMILVTYPVLLYDVKKASQFDSLVPSISLRRAKSLALECLPAVLGMVSCFAVTTVARQYLGIAAGEYALGIYASVCTPAVVIQAGANYVYSPLLGKFATLFFRGELRAFAKLLGAVSAVMAGIFVAGAFGFMLLGEWFLQLAFGPDIAPYGYLLYPALLSIGITAYVAFLGDILISIREMVGSFVGSFASLVVSIPCSILFVDTFGMNGASFAVAAAYAVGAAVMGGFLLRGLKRSMKKAAS